MEQKNKLNSNSVIKVIKRKGEIEPFDREKVARVVQAAGLRPVEADELSKSIAEWVDSTGLSEVTSIQIRDKVFEELQKYDEYAAGLYAWYQNTKDKQYKDKLSL